MELAIHIDINTSEAIKMKIDYNSEKYPASKIKDAKSGDDFYMDQKIKYRKGEKSKLFLEHILIPSQDYYSINLYNYPVSIHATG